MIRALLAVILTVLTLAATPIAAQQPQLPDYEAWLKVADGAEKLIGDDDADNEALSRTREDIVEWRGRFNEAQTLNEGPIAQIREQLQALGPAPAEGEEEDAEIAARRADLQKQLSALQAPQLTAIEALTRANAIIGGLDRVRDQRQATELTRLSPSPLAPSSWRLAVSDGLTLVEGVLGEVRPGQRDERSWLDRIERLPSVAAYLIAAFLLLTVGRRQVASLPSRLSARATDHSRAVVAFLTSLGQIVIPMLGIFLAINALTATGLPGPWTLPILDAVPVAAMILFGGGWLARQLFPRRAIIYDTLEMTEADRNKARWSVDILSVIFALHHIMAAAILPLSGLYERVGQTRDQVPMEFSEGAAAVWHFVLIALAAAQLFRLGNVLRRLGRGEKDTDLPFRHRVLGWAGGLTRIVAIVAVLLTMLGLVNLGNLLIWPWALSLALTGLLIVLLDFTADLFNMIKRGEAGARDGLAPLLIGFGLIVLSIPLFMMIWGAQWTDLAEYWARIESGISIGGIRLSPGSILTFMTVFAVGYFATRTVQGAMRSSILPKTRLDTGGQNAVVAGLGYVGIALAALLAVTSAGIDLSSLAFIAGALSVGIGFGMQNIVSNFVSGIILLIERPISVGDWIDAGGQQGIVKQISVRSTQVQTFDRTSVIVPNSDLITRQVTNWTRYSKIGRIIIPIGVSYGNDTREVERILREIVEDQPLVTIDPAPIVLFRGISVDTLNFEIRAVISDITAGLGVTSEIYHQIVERFRAEGIDIPFTVRDNWLAGKDLPRMPDDAADPTAPCYDDGSEPTSA